MSRNSNPNLVSLVDSTAWLYHFAVRNPVGLIGTMPLSRTFPPQFLQGVARNRSGGTTVLMDRVCRSLVSTLNILLIHTDPAPEPLRFAANYHVHADRDPDSYSKMSGNE